MIAQNLLNTIATTLARTQPSGLDASYIRSFFDRNGPALVSAIEHQLDQMCRPNVPVPGYERVIGYAELPVENGAQIAVFGQDVGSDPHVILAVKARCHPSQPFVNREFAVHSRRADERTFRMHSGESWHRRPEAAIEAFARAHATEIRYREVPDDEGSDWDGVENAPYVLTDLVGIEAAEDELSELQGAQTKNARELEQRREARLRFEQKQRQAAKAGSAATADSATAAATDGASERVVTNADEREITGARDIVNELARFGLHHQGKLVLMSEWGGMSGKLYEHADQRHVELHDSLEKDQPRWILQHRQPGRKHHIPLYIGSELRDVGQQLEAWGFSDKPEAAAPEAPRPDAHGPSVESDDQARPVAAETPQSDPVPTRQDGLRTAAPLAPETLRRGHRVVLADLEEHGTVTHIREWTSSIGYASGHVRETTHYELTVTMDSGRIEHNVSSVYGELQRPTRIIPDPEADGKSYSVATLWRGLHSAFSQLQDARSRAKRARKNTDKWLTEVGKQRERLKTLFLRLDRWMSRHNLDLDYLETYPGLDRDQQHRVHYYWRLIELELDVDRGPAWREEQKLILDAPSDWLTRYDIGDAVELPDIPEAEEGRSGQARIRWVSGKIVVLRGALAEVEIRQDAARVVVPLYLLRFDASAPVELPTYTEPMWLLDLARELLAGEGHSSLPDRGAVARSVKLWLEGEGLPVRTHVSRGTWVTSIELSPPGESWTEAEQKRLGELLSHRVRPNGLRFEPWQREGESYDPYADYGGKGPGIRIPLEQIPKLMPLLARALQGAGQTLSRIGEVWAAQGRTANASADESDGALLNGGGRSIDIDKIGHRGGATAEQRRTAAEGCSDISFPLEGYGVIRVVCGQPGRRDVWHNVFISRSRYGYNGGRWARRNVPPAAVLEAIRERGITAFDGPERLEAPQGEVRLQLDPAVDGLVDVSEQRRETPEVQRRETLEGLCGCARPTSSGRNTQQSVPSRGGERPARQGGAR